MSGQTRSGLPSSFDLQTLQPRLRLHGPIVLLILIGGLPLFFFLEHGPKRIAHCGLSMLALGAVLYHFGKEYRLVHDRLTAVGVVTDYGTPISRAPRFVRFVVSRFAADVPVIKYSFVAFDQKTYTGQTGWRVAGLYKGAKIPILYKPGRPAVNHPAGSFIFYTFAA